tara:strand:+ start:883 stop:1749 length:867 start_codon:yes stop_codon:yes gene_type:complete
MKLFFYNLISIVKIFYGELFNFRNPFKIRIFRILARTNLSKSFVSYYLKKRNNKKIITYKNNLVNINTENSIINLNKDGITLGISINDEALNKIINYLNDKNFNFNRDQKKKIKFQDRHKFKDLYILNYMNPHLENNTIKEILLNKEIIKVIKSYLGADPILEWSQIYWSIPYKDDHGNFLSPPNNEFGYHYDIDGFKFVKIFFYLTEVNENDGPHVFIKNTGKKTFFKAVNRRLSDSVVNEKFKGQSVTITGKRGIGFIEDTSFYHKGTAPINERGILTCLYNVSKW